MTRLKRPVSSRARLFAALLVIVPGTMSLARAQGEFELRLLRPSITVSGIGVQRADFTDVDSDYSAANGTLFAMIPLGGVRLRPDHRVIAWQPMLTMGAGVTSQSFEVVDREPRLYTGLLNGSVLFASSKPNLHYISVGASFAEDEETVNDLELRVSAFYLGSYQKSPSFTWLYGGAYTFIYGRGLLLPAFGLIWKPSDHWSLYGLLPFAWTLSQRFNEHLRLNYMLWASGQQFGFQNDGLFPIADDKVYERVREQHLGVELEWRPGRDFMILTQVGIATARRMAFTPIASGADNLLDEAIDPAPYARLAFRILLGKSLTDELGGKVQDADAP